MVKIFTIITSLFLVYLSACGMKFSVEHKPVGPKDISALEADGMKSVGAKNIQEMYYMLTPSGDCKNKQNICGMQAGFFAGFLLNPREAFYDLNNPPIFIRFGSGTGYDKLGEDYPIMRPKLAPEFDFGVFGHSLANFWSKHFAKHNAKLETFDQADPMLQRIKEQIDQQKPVMLNIKISAPDFPQMLPDQHLGLRTLPNSHWVVVLGYNEKGDGKWLIKDNGGMMGTVDFNLSNPIENRFLFTVTTKALKKLANIGEMAEEIKLYLSEPELPIYIQDGPKNQDEILKKDLETMRAYNILTFERK